MKKVIEISNLYKEYQLGVIGRDTFYRDFQSFIAKIQKKEDPNSNLNLKYIDKGKKFLALKNINLEIFEGEVLGIIGKNGAGKSTLLKLLSRITSPTKGEIKIKGKIASLLEVGTGFHGELTGRENIYLNGAINGMNIHETEKQIEDIINFSGILIEHIDTPVKRYSSGMIVKLGFSVAAFLNYDILICDEVLAVGDQEFQKKALNKLKEINSDSKKTVIFVSHNMDSVASICSKVLIMREGEIDSVGSTADMISKYLNYRYLYKNYFIKNWNDEDAPQSKNIKLKSIATKNNKDDYSDEFDISEKIKIEIVYEITDSSNCFCTNLQFSKNDTFLFQTLDDTINSNWQYPKKKCPGVYKQICEIPENLFDIGEIDINIVIFTPPGDIETSYQIMEPKKSKGVISFKISEIYPNISRGSYPYAWKEKSIYRPICKWETQRV